MYNLASYVKDPKDDSGLVGGLNVLGKVVVRIAFIANIIYEGMFFWMLSKKY